MMQRKRLKAIHNPWLTKGLLKSIRKKAKLYKKVSQKSNVGNEKMYRTFKNKLNHLTRIAKEIIKIKNSVETSRNDLKAKWKMLNDIINKRKFKLTIWPSLRTMVNLRLIHIL